MKSKMVPMALVAVLIATLFAGCNPNREGTATNDRVRPNNVRPFQYGTGNSNDMRLGLDQYRVNDPDLIRDSDDMRLGLNRAGGDRDGVNNWADYQSADGHNNTRMEVAQYIADQLVAIDPIQTANVLLTDRNAYVAVTTKNGQDVETIQQLKTQIADKVHTIKPEIRNVYVSSNPDFVARVNGFVQDLQAGKPMQGLLNEFNTLVQRIFPTDATRNAPGAISPNTPQNQPPSAGNP